MTNKGNATLHGGGSLAHRYARWAMRYRTPLSFAVALITLLAAFQIVHLDIRNDPDTLLPSSNRYVATNLYAEKQFGMGNLMVIGFQIKNNQDDIYQPWFLNIIQDVQRKLEALPNSRPKNFMSLASQKIKYMGVDDSGLVFKRLIPTSGISTDNTELAREQLAFLKKGVEENPVLAPMLLYLEDDQGKRCEYGQQRCVAKATFVIGDFDDGVKEHYLTWIHQVRQILKPLQDDDRFEILVAGEPYFLAYMLAELVNKWWLFVLSLLIVIAILRIEFGKLKRALIPLMGVGATIITTLGVMGLSGFKLTTMMVLTPMLLLAIGIGHAVQITQRYRQERKKGL